MSLYICMGEEKVACNAHISWHKSICMVVDSKPGQNTIRYSDRHLTVHLHFSFYTLFPAIRSFIATCITNWLHKFIIKYFSNDNYCSGILSRNLLKCIYYRTIIVSFFWNLLAGLLIETQVSIDSQFRFIHIQYREVRATAKAL